MKKVVLVASLALLSGVLSAGVKPPQSPSTKVSTTTAANVTGAPADYQAMLNKYCVTCHNQKMQIPAGAPLSLDTANLKDPAADAEVWEKVIRKIGVGAMPPQGTATPGAAELNKFRASLISTLDAAAAKKNNPGRYVIHRLNRTEYGNAIRDLLGVKVDVNELLPSDGGDFGFDNIAAALKTSPLLLERYLTAALQVSDLAVGNTDVAAGTATYSISTEVTQSSMWTDCRSARAEARSSITTSRQTANMFFTAACCAQSQKATSASKDMRRRISLSSPSTENRSSRRLSAVRKITSRVQRTSRSHAKKSISA
jgi:cytochrome c5